MIFASGGFGADFTRNSLLGTYRPDLLHLSTTNDEHCTGDGIKMGEAIGVKTIDLEWVQVHQPDDPVAKIKFLASEALRGVGGLVFDALGNLFAYKLGTRDCVTGEMWKNKLPFRLALNMAAFDEIALHALQAFVASPPAGARGNPARRRGAEEHVNSAGAKEATSAQYARVNGVLRGGAPPLVRRDAHGQCEQQRLTKPAARTAPVESQPPVLRPLEFTKLWSYIRMFRVSKLSQITKALKIAAVNMHGMNFLSLHARDKVAGLIEAARKGSWQLAAILDVAGGSDEHVCCYAIEKFLFVTWDVAMLARQWRRYGTCAGQRRRERGRPQPPVPHGRLQDWRSTVRLPHWKTTARSSLPTSRPTRTGGGASTRTCTRATGTATSAKDTTFRGAVGTGSRGRPPCTARGCSTGWWRLACGTSTPLCRCATRAPGNWIRTRGGTNWTTSSRTSPLSSRLRDVGRRCRPSASRSQITKARWSLGGFPQGACRAWLLTLRRSRPGTTCSTSAARRRR